ncbi:response regulator transcription factor [Nocardioides sp. JQ2195]|nr:response regulator transcription factor [Nocardioides sp. JQ2195]
MEGHDVRRIVLPEGGRSVHTLLPIIMRAKPRVALLDLDLGTYGNGGRLVEPLTLAGVNVVVVTSSIDRGRWGECVRYGARKILPKSSPLNDILATIRRITEGLPVMTQDEREELLKHWHAQVQEIQLIRSRLENLTHRESQVLAQLMDGRAVREIARMSVVSEATVRTQVKSILSKLEVSSQLAAVGCAHHVGWAPAGA